jgi:L,D-peptidoglycan transpeptidase YkuD (ErfK/YbiS/YcfS/YnhG family)
LLGHTVYGTSPDPGVRLRYHRLVCGDWWDEDPASPTYNRFQHVRCNASPSFKAASEALWLGGRAYTLFGLIDYNTAPIVAGAGSAIFLHADKGGPTNGCISLTRPHLVRVLVALHPDAVPAVAITVVGG